MINKKNARKKEPEKIFSEAKKVDVDKFMKETIELGKFLLKNYPNRFNDDFDNNKENGKNKR